MEMALERGQLNASDIDLVSTHATATDSGDVQECIALRKVFSNGAQPDVKQHEEFLSATRWAQPEPWSLLATCPAFDDGVCHATINVDRLDPQCELPGLAVNEPRVRQSVRYILNKLIWYVGD